MSSTYRRICLSHNPPLVIHEDEFQQPVTGELRHEDHRDCLVGVARWSASIIEFWLPHDGKWVDVAWIYRYPELARALMDGRL